MGIVTDRDLTVRAVGRALDPRTTPLADVMTTPVATLAPTDSQDDALRLMQQRNVRRIPLVEAGRLVGIVTLDDLLLDEAAPLEQWPRSSKARSARGARPPRSGRRPHGGAPAPRRPTDACSTDCARRRTWRPPRRRRWRWRSSSGRWCVGSRRTRRRTSSPSSLPCSSPRCARCPPARTRASRGRRSRPSSASGSTWNRPCARTSWTSFVGTIAQIVSPGQMQDVRDQLPEGLRILSGGSPVAPDPLRR